MTVPSAGELVSGFWAGDYPSGPVDTYALAAYLVGRNAAGYGEDAPLRGWTVRADERVSPGPDGRPTYGYPAPSPGGDPAWIAYDLGGGRILANGPDYTVTNGYVWFETDPTLTATVRGHVWVDGGPVATATLLWSPGRPTPPAVPPPAGTHAALTAAVAAACDSPATGAGVETVEAVQYGPDSRYRVVTDASAYRLPVGDTPGVSVGDVLPPGSPLGTAWSLTRLGVPYPDLPHVAVPPEFLPGSTATGPVAFYNHDVATVVDTDGGRTRVRWALGGQQADVDAVWTASHAWGTGPGDRTLAEAMDTRVGPTTEPTAADLPVSVNPFQFACRELFAGNAYLLVVDVDKFGEAAVSVTELESRLRAAAGPFAALITWTGGTQPAPTETAPS